MLWFLQSQSYREKIIHLGAKSSIHKTANKDTNMQTTNNRLYVRTVNSVTTANIAQLTPTHDPLHAGSVACFLFLIRALCS